MDGYSLKAVAPARGARVGRSSASQPAAARAAAGTHRVSARVMHFGGFRLDTDDQCLWRELESGVEERIDLAPKAYRVLLHLVERAGRLVTQNELLDAVWPNAHIQPEGLKAQILQIRRALGDDPKQPRFIETLPRRGYRFVGAGTPAGANPHGAIWDATPASLVGRERALDSLAVSLQRALHGRRQFVFVTGESGIGKTALVDAFRLRLEGNVPGLRVARGQCVEGYGGKEPYYPMLEALAQLMRGPSGESVAATLAIHAPSWLSQFPGLVKEQQGEALAPEMIGARRNRMLREIGQAVELIASEEPLLLIFEDLQWVDQATVDLISALARRRDLAKLMLLGTLRPIHATGEIPIMALMQELLCHQLCRDVALAPLTVEEIRSFLGEAPAQANEPARMAPLLHRYSGGNPLFMMAALEHLAQRGLIARDGEAWRATRPTERIDLGVPEVLRVMLETEIERLSPTEQRALEAASVIGASFTVDQVAAAADLAPESVEDLCEHLSRRPRIVRSCDDRPAGRSYEFVHSLYRQILYERQPASRRARLHRRVGENLESSRLEQASEIAPELAEHFERASDWPRAIKYHSLAASSAGRSGDREAVALLTHALGLAHNLPDANRSVTETMLLGKLATLYGASIEAPAVES